MIPRRLLVLTLRVKWHVLASIVAILAVTSTYLATALATATALGALTNGIGATVNVRAVVSRNEAAFEKTKRRLRAAGVELANG